MENNTFKKGDLVLVYKADDDGYYAELIGLFGIIRYSFDNKLYDVDIINDPLPDSNSWYIHKDVLRYPTEEELILYGK